MVLNLNFKFRTIEIYRKSKIDKNTCLVLSKTMIFDGSTLRAAIPAECIALRADESCTIYDHIKDSCTTGPPPGRFAIGPNFEEPV